MAASREDDHPALALFASELKAARAGHGLSREELAGQVSYSASLIGMVESCRRVPSLDFARRCDEALGTSGTFARMQAYLRAVSFPAWFRPFVDYEAEAVSLRGFEHSLVPGLLQTCDYARAVLATRPNTSEEETDDLVVARLDRQAILERDDPPLLWAVLDEGVLNRQVGSDKVMHDQLAHLAEMSERPNITVEVIPYGAGAHSGLLGAFVIAEVAEAPSIVYLETTAGGEIVEESSAVARVALTFDTLRADALPRRASRELIMKVAEERWT
jgi:transcriptional regulator with XRE-family HTH domain